MSSTFHIGFGDTSLDTITVYPNGTSGSSTNYYRIYYPNGFDYVATNPTAVAFKATSSSTGINCYWYWFRADTFTSGKENAQTTNGYTDGKNYCLIAHSSGVNGSLTFLSACDGDYLPTKMTTTTPSGTYNYSTYPAYNGHTIPYGSFSANTAFYTYVDIGGLAEQGGSLAGRNLTGGNNITISGTSDTGYNASRDYIIVSHGKTGVTYVTVYANAGDGITSATANGSSSAQVTVGNSVYLTCTKATNTTTTTELATQVRKTLTSYTYDGWYMSNGDYYAGQSATIYPTTNLTGTAYANSSTSNTYAWRLSFSNNGGSGSQTAILGSFTSSGSSTITTPTTCTITPPSSLKKWSRYWSDGTNVWLAGATITRSTHLTVYPVWEDLISGFTWTNSDATYVVSGQPIATAITASKWNTFADKIYDCAIKQGIAIGTIGLVYQGDMILYSDFNTLVANMRLLRGYTTNPNTVSSGDSFLASRFHGNSSIKTMLNQIIEYTNNNY